MALFGSDAKRRAKKSTPADWMLWSYLVRVESNEAAVAVGTADQNGQSALDIARQLHRSCWSGAANEAASYYGAAAVAVVFENADLEANAAEQIVQCQFNQTLVPTFTAEVVEDLQREIRTYRQAEAITGLQRRYAYLSAEPAPLVTEMEERRAVRQQLEALGAAPDLELNAQVKRELGVPDTPFNT